MFTFEDTFVLRTVIKTLQLLNSETGPWQLAFGASFGMILGLTPLLNLHNVLVLLLICLLRVNISFVLLFMGLSAGFAYLFDNQFHQLGYQLLNSETLIPLWTDWYNDALLRWSRFNNTVVLGSLVASLALFFPVALLVRFAVGQYRQRWQKKLEQTRFMQLLKASRWTEAFSKLGE